MTLIWLVNWIVCRSLYVLLRVKSCVIELVIWSFWLHVGSIHVISRVPILVIFILRIIKRIVFFCRILVWILRVVAMACALKLLGIWVMDEVVHAGMQARRSLVGMHHIWCERLILNKMSLRLEWVLIVSLPLNRHRNWQLISRLILETFRKDFSAVGPVLPDD